MQNHNSNKQIKLVDCTLRDGGYYNKWNFSRELIADYLDAMSSINVSYIELGYRFIENSSFLGGCAFSTDDFIRDLNIPDSLQNKIGVMINSSDLLRNGSTPIRVTKVLENLFTHKKFSCVTLVRIACKIDHIEECFLAAKWLKKMGYKVGMNLMQINFVKKNKLIEILHEADSFNIDVIYFADSFGSLESADIKDLLKIFKENWNGDIGFHAHDNMGKALDNTITAINNGACWVDSTVAGMGRGAGNVKTEYLSIELEKNTNTNKAKLFKLIKMHFKPMEEKFNWGSNSYYFLAGKYNIHPLYIQQMVADSRFLEEDILTVIDYLRKKEVRNFDNELIELARTNISKKNTSQWLPQSKIHNRNVIIIGAGPSTIMHKKAIELFIRKYKPYVIALNTSRALLEELIDIRVACHPLRIITDIPDYLNFSTPIIIPSAVSPNDLSETLNKKEIYFFDIDVKKDKFKFEFNNCIIPNLLAISYALAIATCGKAKQIFIAGFDGYENDTTRNNEMNDIFDTYLSDKKSVPLFSVTQTIYKIPSKSIYGPLV